jgi:triosephosphate isomerase
MAPIVVGVSLKMYFGLARARDWFGRVAELARENESVKSGAVDGFVIPSFVAIPGAMDAFAGTRVRIGAQDLFQADSGAYTGEVSGAELAELGVGVVEVGHTAIGSDVGGLFLGRFAHDPAALASVLDEAAMLARTTVRA